VFSLPRCVACVVRFMSLYNNSNINNVFDRGPFSHEMLWPGIHPLDAVKISTIKAKPVDTKFSLPYEYAKNVF
jgi:hypothetical protein